MKTDFSYIGSPTIVYPASICSRNAIDGSPDCVEISGGRGTASEYGFSLEGNPDDFISPITYGVCNVPIADAGREICGALCRNGDARYPYAIVFGIKNLA